LYYELEGKVDCIDWALGQVKTNLNRDPKGPGVATASEAVHGILKNLGKTESSSGCAAHDSIFLGIMTEKQRSKFLYRMFKTTVHQVKL
jgi:hypothetical protein